MFPITQAGYGSLKKRLLLLKEEFDKLPEIIAEARERGDLKENAEYHAARERQGILNAEIAKVTAQIAQSQIVDPKTMPEGTVTFGKHVVLLDLNSHLEESYTLVGLAEADLEMGKISVTSQMARGILGKKVGDNVEIEVPAGKREYLVKSVRYVEP